MNAEEPSPPFFPWGLLTGSTSSSRQKQQTADYQQALEKLGWAPADEGEWVAHVASGWLCNPIERVFFHAERNILLPAADSAAGAAAAADTREAASSSDETPPAAADAGGLDPLVQGYEDVNSAQSDGESSDLMLDLEDDLEAATAQKKAKGKENCEDRFVTRAGLPLGVVAGDSEGLCYFTAIYDGHAGTDCADYAVAHLHKNLLSSYRQLHRTVQRRRQEELEKQSGRKRKKPLSSQWLQQLNQSSDPLRPEERRLSVEVEALVRSCFSAFSLTDKNYLGLSEKALAQDAGSTACVAIFFGPDERGALQLVTAHAGDSRAVLCRDGRAFRLTQDHKPNSSSEQKRIEAAGGQVASIQGVWRVLAADTRGGRTVGLSTSRALGDLALKKPKPLVISNPTVHVYTLHFERDAFLVLGSDGVFEVLCDEEVVDLILSRLPQSGSLYSPSSAPWGCMQAAQLVVDEAVARGGTDDKTCTVIYFKWRKDLFSRAEEEEEAGEGPPASSQQQQETDKASSDQGGLLRDQCSPARTDQPAAAAAQQQPKRAEEEDGRLAAAAADVRPEQPRGPHCSSSSKPACGGEAHAAPAPAATAEAAGLPETAGGHQAAAAAESQKREGLAAAVLEEAEEESSRHVRSSGIEEIAGITSSLDVEALIRKRKREQRMEAEAAAAAAAAAHDDEDDLDIFGAAPPPDSPPHAATAEDSESE
ncbi:hypothetical protein Efla_002770 [Eimeria flavescens]